jgi:cell cycle arrest protein BUB3
MPSSKCAWEVCGLVSDLVTALYNLSPAPEDALSAIQFSPTSYKLLAAAWDRNVYLYDAQQGLETNLLQTYQHRAPVLDVCFGENEGVAYSGGLDWDVRRYVPDNDHYCE